MQVLVRILAIVFAHKLRLSGAMACVVGATASYVLLPRLFGDAIDQIAVTLEGGESSDSALLNIALLILGISALRGLLTFGQTHLGEALAQSVVYDLRNRFYNHVQHLSFAAHDRYHTGNLMSRAITDVEAIRMFVHGGVVQTVYYLLLFVSVPVVLIRLDWRLGLISMAFIPIAVVMGSAIRLRLSYLWRGIQERLAAMSTRLQENLTGVRVVKAFASEDYEQARFSRESKTVAGQMVNAYRLWTLNVSTAVLLYLVTMGLVLWYGGYLTMAGQLSPGELAQFLFYMQVLALPVQHSGFIVNNFARATSAGQRLFAVLDAESPVRQSPDAVEMPRARGHVRFDDVGFSYDRRTQVIKGIEIDAQPGQVIALLGAPGSGKSTIVNLLPRFYDVGTGRITIDGKDVRDVTLESLRRNIGIVQQDVFLFTMSLRDNIAYGRESATLDEVVEAARVAQLSEYIEGLEEGYDTMVGERGSTLSGGQRQRLAIARAVLLDPPILILDDSTSSVDAGTEERIRKAMESVMRGRTTFVIAHRLSTVHKADQILVLKDGGIAEQGRHEELLAQGGLYRQIYDLQLRPQEEVLLDIDEQRIAS